MSPPVLRIAGLRKAWGGRPVLDGVDLTIGAGEHTLIRGASGAGKSTLLGVLARLVRADAGTVHLDGRDIQGLGRATAYRRRHLGLIFQDPHLVDSLTALQNIEMASLNQGDIGASPEALLARLGLKGHAGVRAGVLSRGERQRLAIARAFVGRPRLVLADEPTASLDPAARDAVLRQLSELADAAGATVLLVSHDPDVDDALPFAQRIVLDRGRIRAGASPREGRTG